MVGWRVCFFLDSYNSMCYGEFIDRSFYSVRVSVCLDSTSCRIVRFIPLPLCASVFCFFLLCFFWLLRFSSRYKIMRSHNKAICVDFNCLSLFIIIMHRNILYYSSFSSWFIHFCLLFSQIKSQKISLFAVWNCLDSFGFVSFVVCKSVGAANATLDKRVEHWETKNGWFTNLETDKVSIRLNENHIREMRVKRSCRAGICDSFEMWVDDFVLNWSNVACQHWTLK